MPKLTSCPRSGLGRRTAGQGLESSRNQTRRRALTLRVPKGRTTEFIARAAKLLLGGGVPDGQEGGPRLERDKEGQLGWPPASSPRQGGARTKAAT